MKRPPNCKQFSCPIPALPTPDPEPSQGSQSAWAPFCRKDCLSVSVVASIQSQTNHNRFTISQNKNFDHFETSSKFTKQCACNEKWLRKHLSFRPPPANVLTTCKRCRACHADETVSDVLRLSRRTTFWTFECLACPRFPTKSGHNLTRKTSEVQW